MVTMRVLKFGSTEYKIPGNVTLDELGKFFTTLNKLVPIYHTGIIIEEGYRTEIAIISQRDPNTTEPELEPEEETV